VYTGTGLRELSWADFIVSIWSLRPLSKPFIASNGYRSRMCSGLSTLSPLGLLPQSSRVGWVDAAVPGRTGLAAPLLANVPDSRTVKLVGAEIAYLAFVYAGRCPVSRCWRRWRMYRHRIRNTANVRNPRSPKVRPRISGKLGLDVELLLLGLFATT
jgi:hypothetical protein